MSEPIGVTIYIGGVLPASLIKEFLAAVCDDMDNLQGETSREELEAVSGKQTLRYDGTANWGVCDILTAFCEENNLTYTISAESNGECDQDITYWVPGMEEHETIKTDIDNNLVVRVDAIKSITDLMYALITRDQSALAQFINDPTILDLVSVGLNDPDNFNEALRKKLDEILPEVPGVPVLTIDFNK